MRFPLLRLVALALISGSFAEAAIRVDSTALPKGVTAAEAGELAAMLDKVAAATKAKEDAQQQELRRTVEVIPKPYVDQFTKTVNGSAKYKSGYDDHCPQAKDIMLKPGLSPKVRSAAMAALNEKYRALFQEICKIAAIDENAYFASLKNTCLAHHRNYKPGKTYPYLFQGFLTVSYAEPIAISPPPAACAVELCLPFSLVEESGVGNHRVSSPTGTYATESSVIILGAKFDGAGVGHFLMVPTGCRTVEVSATLYGEGMMVAGAGLGGSYADAKSGITILREDGTFEFRMFDHGSVWAPVVWYAELTDTGAKTFTNSIPAPPANTSLSVLFNSWTSAQSFGPAAANSRVFAGVGTGNDPIRNGFVT